MSRAVKLSPEQQALLDEAVERRLERDRRRHRRELQGARDEAAALRRQLAEAQLDAAALRLTVEQLEARTGGSWLRLLPHWFTRHDDGGHDDGARAR